MTASDMTSEKLLARYGRIATQLEQLFTKVSDPLARMASAAALLHAKMPHHSWTGFYRLVDSDLLVAPYQGPLACMLLARDTGVCWACVRRGEPMLVADVRAFEGHIACDPKTRSEVVVPVWDSSGTVPTVRAVLDVDSAQVDAFGEADREGLERIAALIYG